jgi:hypothetical protein
MTTGSTVAGQLPVPDQGTVVAPAGGRPIRTVRRARVSVTRVDPWSVMKLSFVLTVSLSIVILVATAILYWVLSASGVFDQLQSTILSVTGPDTSFRLTTFVSFGRVLAVTTILAVIDIILLTALATLGAFLFNLTTGLVGGVDVVLTESD